MQRGRAAHRRLTPSNGSAGLSVAEEMLASGGSAGFGGTPGRAGYSKSPLPARMRWPPSPAMNRTSACAAWRRLLVASMAAPAMFSIEPGS